MGAFAWILIIILIIVVIGVGLALLFSFTGNGGADDGQSCNGDSGCASNNCSNNICQASGVTSGEVGAKCIIGSTTTGGQCDTGLTCTGSSSTTGSIGTCSSPSATKTPNGGSCMSNSDCNSNNCVNNICTTTSSGSLPDGSPCTSSSQCMSTSTCFNNVCTASGGTGGDTLFYEPCTMTTDCRLYNTCTTSIGVTDTDRCLFRANPNSCPSGSCLSGFTCTDSACLATTGLFCTNNSQCVSGTCSTPGSISHWNGRTWDFYLPVPTGVTFNRLEVVSAVNQDAPNVQGFNLWGFDRRSGIYYAGAGSSSFTRIIPNVGNVPNSNEPATMIDMAVGANNNAYIIYRNNEGGSFQLLRATSNGSLFPPPNLFNFPDSTLISAPGGNTMSNVTNIDVLINSTGNYIIITGQQAGNNTSSTYQTFFSNFNSNFNQVSSFFVNSNTILKYIENPDLSFGQQVNNFNQLAPPNLGTSDIECKDCVAYSGQANTDGNSPIGNPNLTIVDYDVTTVGTGASRRNNTYFIAQNLSTQEYNLYVAPGTWQEPVTIGQFAILPGYYNVNSRVAVLGNDIFIYSNNSCQSTT